MEQRKRIPNVKALEVLHTIKKLGTCAMPDIHGALGYVSNINNVRVGDLLRSGYAKVSKTVTRQTASGTTRDLNLYAITESGEYLLELVETYAREDAARAAAKAEKLKAQEREKAAKEKAKEDRIAEKQMRMLYRSRSVRYAEPGIRSQIALPNSLPPRPMMATSMAEARNVSVLEYEPYRQQPCFERNYQPRPLRSILNL